MNMNQAGTPNAGELVTSPMCSNEKTSGEEIQAGVTVTPSLQVRNLAANNEEETNATDNRNESWQRDEDLRSIILGVEHATVTLDWSNRTLSRHDVLSLRNAILVAFALDASSLKLERINLSNSQLTDTAVAPLVDTLGQWTYRHSYHDSRQRHAPRRSLRLREIDFSHNQLSSDVADKIVDMIFLIPSLLYVRLDGNPRALDATDDDSNGALDMIDDTLHARRSSSRRNPQDRNEEIQPACVEVMDELNLSGLQLGDAGIDLLFVGMSARRVVSRDLILSGNSITAVGAQVIANFFHQHHEMASQIQTLQLDYNCLGPKGVTVLATLVPQLSSLYVARNQCGDDGASALAEAICHDDSRLSTLSLLGNSISLTGSRELAKVYLRKVGDDSTAPRVSSLRILHLGDNPSVGDEGAALLAEAISDYTVLVEQARRVSLDGEDRSTPNCPRDTSDEDAGCNEGYLSVWQCNVTDSGAWGLVGAANALLSSREKNEAVDSSSTMSEIVDLDLEWNPVSIEVQQSLQELQRQVQTIQRREQEEKPHQGVLEPAGKT